MPASARKRSPVQLELPIHEFAAGHRVLHAVQQYKTRERISLVKRKRPCAEVAAERIREFAWDMGAEMNHYRWMAFAARELGLSYSTARAIINGSKFRVGPDVVDQIAAKTCCPVSVFYDEEF